MNGVNSLPTKQEVYDWEEEDLEFNDRLRKAEVRRARSTIEAYYKNANEAMKSNDKEVVDLVNAKKKIADSAQACINQENSSVSIVINSALPKIWGLKEMKYGLYVCNLLYICRCINVVR